MISEKTMYKLSKAELGQYAYKLQYHVRTQAEMLSIMQEMDRINRRVAECREIERSYENRSAMEEQMLHDFTREMEAKYNKPSEEVSECSDLPFTTDNKEENEATVNDFLRFKANDTYANIYIDGEFVEQTKENKSEKYGNEKPTCYSIGQIEGKPCFQIFIGGKNP